MISSVRPAAIGMIAIFMLAGCASPNYVNKGEGETTLLGWNEVTFQVYETFKQSPPTCVAILPLGIKSPDKPKATAEDASKVRRSLYAHLSTQSKHSIKLERVDYALNKARSDRQSLGESLQCDAVIEGQVIEYGDAFWGIYSRVAVGVELKLIRTSDGAVLWEGSHVAVSHGGTIPLDPVGVAMGVADAASNVRDEQILRVTDDVARRLVSTIPDNKVLALDDPGGVVTSEAAPPPADDIAMTETLLAQGDNAGALMAANRAVQSHPDQAKAWFIKGRILMLNQDYAGAEPAIVKAVALDQSNAQFLNALGVINAQKGAMDRALAAYQMAVVANPVDGFAWFNTAVIYYNMGNLPEAADGFYAAGLAYVKTANYAKAELALTELRDLSKAGPTASHQIQTLQAAIAASTRSKS